LLRTGYSIAKDVNAEFYVVYVSAPSFKELSDREKVHLSEALNLAEELGAKTVTLTGTDIAREILRFAAENNITRVVVGKPIRSSLSELFKSSPVQKLLHAPAQFEIHLITPMKEKEPVRARTATIPRFEPKEYLLTAGMVAVVTLVNLLLQKVIDPVSLVFLYLIATIASALRFGRGPSLFASVLSLLTFDFFFTEPRYTLSMYHAKDIVNVVVFFFTSLAVGQLTRLTKVQDYALRLRLQRITLVEEMSKEFLKLPPVEQLIGGFAQHAEEWKGVLPLLRTTMLDDISHIIVKYVAKVVDAPSFVLFSGQDGKLRVWAKTGSVGELSPHEMAVAEWVFAHGEQAGAGTQTLANVKACFIPMRSEGDVVGLIGIEYEYKNLLADQRRLLGAIANLSALGAIRWVKA
jgi:two-component system sensor histidine kinase KdpD